MFTTATIKDFAPPIKHVNINKMICLLLLHMHLLLLLLCIVTGSGITASDPGPKVKNHPARMSCKERMTNQRLLVKPVSYLNHQLKQYKYYNKRSTTPPTKEQILGSTIKRSTNKCSWQACGCVPY